MTARIIVDKALDPSTAGSTFHVTNPKPPPFQLAVDVLRDMGYNFKELPYGTWRERVIRCAAEDNALRPLEFGFAQVRPPKPPFVITLDCTNAGIHENTINAEQLRRDFTWCERVGFFPPLHQSTE